MKVKIYLECAAVREDMAGNGSLCGAVGRVWEENLADIYILGGNPQKLPFEYAAVSGNFNTLCAMPDISKDIVYISRVSEDIISWSVLCGKGILVTKRPYKSDSYNTVCPACEGVTEIYDKLRKYIHIKEYVERKKKNGR